MKITATTVGGIRLPAGKAEHFEFDDEIAGFFVRIRAGGSRTFGYQYRIGKQNRRITLGTAAREAFPGIRQRVLELEAQVRLGNDPAAAKEASKRAAAESFKAVADLYLSKQAKTARPRTYEDEQRYLMVKAKSLHTRPIATITRRDIAGLLTATEEGVTKGTGASTANRLRAILSALFSWAMREGLCETNPCINTNKREEVGRKRVLPLAELVEIWHALSDDNFSTAMKLLMLTGQRRNEIGALRWSEIDEGLTRITLPPDRQKNKGGKERADHIVPLSEPARDILARQPHVVGWHCVFTASSAGIGNWGHYKASLDEKLLAGRTAAGRPPMLPWTIHDLRRSVATRMAEDLGVMPHTIESVLNHYSGSKAGVAGIYNHAKYLRETTQALAMWGEHLMAAVSRASAKVIPIRAA